MNPQPVPIWKLVLAGVGAVVGFVILLLVLWSGYKAVHRYQQRADASNRIQVNQQYAKAAAANIAVIKARAEQRYQESVGIRRAQDEIQKTLTPLYVQWEAIQAQLKMASGQNHTLVWIPSGTNGVPTLNVPDLANPTNGAK